MILVEDTWTTTDFEHASIWTLDDTGARTQVARKGPTTTISPDIRQGIAETVVDIACAAASAEVRPLLEHRVLRDARLFLARRDSRRAVIEAVTSVELALTTWAAAQGSEVSANMKSANGFVSRLDVASAAGLQLPVTVDVANAELAKRRNAAVHEATEPAREEADKAMDLATKLVLAASPNPVPPEHRSSE